MLIVETIAKIRCLFREHRSIREISRELRPSRKVVRKALRSDKTAFTYKRQHQPRPHTCRTHTSLGGLTPNAFATRSRQDQNQNGLWL